MVENGRGDWQQRYDKSIDDEEQGIAEAEAIESEWSKLLARSTYTGTGLDFLLVPFVLIIFGIPALRRHLQNRRKT